MSAKRTYLQIVLWTSKILSRHYQWYSYWVLAPQQYFQLLVRLEFLLLQRSYYHRLISCQLLLLLQSLRKFLERAEYNVTNYLHEYVEMARKKIEMGFKYVDDTMTLKGVSTLTSIVRYSSQQIFLNIEEVEIYENIMLEVNLFQIFAAYMKYLRIFLTPQIVSFEK